MRKKLLFDQTNAIRKLPENIREKDIAVFVPELEHETDPVYRCEIENAMVTVDGLVYSRGKLAEESLMSRASGEWFPWSYYILQRLVKKKRRLDPALKVVHCFNCWSEGYFHWITDILPRLFCIKEELGDATLLLPEISNRIYSRRTAIKKTLLPEKEKLPLDGFYWQSLAPFRMKGFATVPSDSCLAVKNLTVVSPVARSGNYHVELMKGVRKLYHDFYIQSIPGKKYPERIYISRQKATRRKIVNEEEVVQLLRAYDFSILFFENLSFEEQVRHSFYCRTLVSLHGGGLTNILFMNAETKVLEMSTVDERKNLCYFSLANAMDVKYYFQFCKRENESLSVQDADVFVDMQELKANLELMLNS